jgi:arsenate reductase
MATLLKVLVLCTGNSCRSQMAHGYLSVFGKEKLEVYSAGIETHGVNPRAIMAMKEDGVDISKHSSNKVDEYINIEFDYIITVCDHAKENCPYFASKATLIHAGFSDPAKAKSTEEEIMEQFREVRNEIKVFCKKFSQNK